LYIQIVYDKRAAVIFVQKERGLKASESQF